MILDNQKPTNINNLQIEEQGLSVDLGRLDFTRNDIEENNNINIQNIKIIDLRKNEHYGDVHIFLNQPSPFTVKAKSRKAELFLLRKSDAIRISNNFPNIWKRIHYKSYHNLVSIKKLTIKALKHYYENYFYNKNKKENQISFNLDATRNSDLSILEKNNFSNKNINNLAKNIKLNKESKFNPINQSSNRIINNKIKIIIDHKSKRRRSIESYGNDLNFSYNSGNTNSLNNNSSNFKFDKKEEEKEKNRSSNTLKISKIESTKVIQKNSDDNFSSKSNENNSSNVLSSNATNLKNINLQNQNVNKEINSEIQNNKSQKKIDKSSNTKSEDNIETFRYFNDKIKNENCNNIITLQDINQNFSKKIKKIMKKRKKIEKFRELLKLYRLKINKNALQLYTERKDNFNHSEILKTNKMFSELINSSLDENESQFIKEDNNLNFSIDSLKITNSDSFEIKSSYKNMNILTKGEIIYNKKYKKFIEKLIKISNISNLNEGKIKKIISIVSKILKKNKNISEISSDNKNSDFFSEGINSSISEIKYKNMIIEEEKNYNKNYYIKEKTKANTDKEKYLVSPEEQKIYKKDKHLFKLELDNFEKYKTNSFKKDIIDFPLKQDINENYINSKIIQRSFEDRKYYQTKNRNNIIKQEQTNNDKTYTSNDYFESENKIYLKNENKLSFLNKKNDNDNSKKIQKNIPLKKKDKNCIVY